MPSDREVLIETLMSLGRKLKKGMDDGPDGPDVVLTPAEATLAYRTLTENLGLRFD